MNRLTPGSDRRNIAAAQDRLQEEIAGMSDKALHDHIDAVRGNPKRGPFRGFAPSETYLLTTLLDEQARRSACPVCGATNRQPCDAGLHS